MIRRAAIALAAVVVVQLAAAAAPTSAPRAQAVIPPPNKRVYMISDSVGLGAKTAMPQAFPGDWQVTVDGQPALFVEQLLSKYVKPREATPYVFGDYAIVAAGYNYPYWDPKRFDNSVDAMISELLKVGTKHIFWVTLREVKPQYITATAWKDVQPYYWYFPTVNEHLRAALDRWPQLSLIDWAAIADQPGITYDAIHLNTTGAALYSGLAARTVQTTANRLPAGTTTELTVAGANGVPADALAVSLNLTVVNPRQRGWLTAYPCGGAVPVVSNLNFRPAETVANTAIVPVGADGKVCIYQSTDAHVIADLAGAFTADSGFVQLTPTRALDTRLTSTPAAGATLDIDLSTIPGVPANPAAVVLQVTTLGSAVPGDLFVFPCGTTPSVVPSRPFVPGALQNLLVLAAVDANGHVCVKVSQPTQVLVDVFGAFAAGADVHPSTPQRLLDTRWVSQALVPADSTTTQQISGLAGIPASPAGAVVTITAYKPSASGWLAAYPCAAGLPLASILNVVPNHDQMNSTVLGPDANGQLCIYTTSPAQLTLDVTEWSASGFQALTPVRLIDSRTLG